MNKRKKKFTATSVIFIVFSMVVLSFASVPLYDLFCRTTGFGGTPSISDNVKDLELKNNIKIRVLFNADTAKGLEWNFFPLQREKITNLGESTLAFYEARNYSDRPITGFATFNVVPLKIGKYFTKVDCFCFEEQTLNAGEKIEMPVSFYIDPKIAEDPSTKEVKTVTLSYTFFENEKTNDQVSKIYIEESKENIKN